MGIPRNFRGDIRPFIKTVDGHEVPAVFIVGGTVALASGPENDQVLLTDAETGSLVTIPWEHHQGHNGEMMHAEQSFAAVNNNASAQLRVLTGAKHVHAVFFVGHGGQSQLFFYEAANINGGTSVPVVNMNRNSAHVGASTVFHTPNVVGTGTPLVNGRILPGGTTAQSRVGGGIRSETEWELKPATEYLFRATNISGAPIAVSIGVEFYER